MANEEASHLEELKNDLEDEQREARIENLRHMRKNRKTVEQRYKNGRTTTTVFDVATGKLTQIPIANSE